MTKDSLHFHFVFLPVLPFNVSLYLTCSGLSSGEVCCNKKKSVINNLIYTIVEALIKYYFIY